MWFVASPGASPATDPPAARLVRRWPATLEHRPLRDPGGPDDPTFWGRGKLIEIAPSVPRGRCFDVCDAALRAGAWVALPIAGLDPLARGYGVEGTMGPVWILAPRPARRRRLGRRAVDVLVSGGALLILSPVLLLLAVAVRVSSPGPALYRTRVVGEGERPFTWYKFRTMQVADADADDARAARFAAFARGEPGNGPDLKIVDQRRVTRLGAFLRRHSLDELPQLWNVLWGDMSLLGPRPCLPYESKHYEGWQRRRFLLRPGLTGLWQVFGRSRVGFEDAAMLDVLYGYVGGLRFDCDLLARTLLVVLRGEGGR